MATSTTYNALTKYTQLAFNNFSASHLDTLSTLKIMLN